MLCLVKTKFNKNKLYFHDDRVEFLQSSVNLEQLELTVIETTKRLWKQTLKQEITNL